MKPNRADNSLRVVSFNLCHGRPNGSRNEEFAPLAGLPPLEAAARDLASLDPDVILVQEADLRQVRSGCKDQVALIAAATSLPFHAFQSFYSGQVWSPRLGAANYRTSRPARLPRLIGGFGIGIISRFPFTLAAGRRLGAAAPTLKRGGEFNPYPGFNRAALAARLDLGRGRHLSVATTHLELIESVAKKQLASAWNLATGLGTPALLAGDFNLDLAASSAVLPAAKLHAVPSFPANNPSHAIDIAALSREVGLRQIRAITLAVSDHCAIVIDIDLEAQISIPT